MTKLCRFNDDRLGIVDGNWVVDVSPALSVLPSLNWPAPLSDVLVANLPAVLRAAAPLVSTGPRVSLDEARFQSPVANPSKVIAAPVNYLKHQAEANADGGRNFAKDVKTIDEYGLFLKANSSVVGFGEGIEITFPKRRTDHELELVAVIGKAGRNIRREQSLAYIAGYCLGLDMTLRGPEDRSLRKSLDTFSIVGPWMVTTDEVQDPNTLDLRLEVNGVVRQQANTRDLVFNVQRLVEYASMHYSLMPGDLIFTGTPEGVGPVVVGDQLHCSIESIGSASISVRSAAVQHANAGK